MALFIYLLLTDQIQRRETLAALFWPESGPATGRADLSRILSVLRKTMGEGWLVANRQTVGLAPEADIWVDVLEFRRLLALTQSHHHAKGQLCEACLTALSAAVQLYQGDFMAGFTLSGSPEFDDWQTWQTESLRRELGQALAQLAQWQALVGDYQTALRSAQRRLKLDPLHEPAQRQLMRIYAWAGDRNGAIRQYQSCCCMLEEEIGLSPGQATRDLHAMIQSGQMPPLHSSAEDVKTPALLHNILPQPAPFIGRQEELAHITTLVMDQSTCRLLTLVGPGGMGKTRLALEVARNLAENFRDGAAFVSLAPLSDAKAIVPAVAQALRVNFLSGGGRDQDTQLLDYLRGKELLLALDNFEHLLDAAPLLAEIVRTAPTVKLLVTSRERLNLQAEQVFPLQGMELSNWESLTEAHDDPAVKLFLHHAQRVQPSFTLRPQHLLPLHEIFRQVGGMPLAVILAAGWVRVLSPAEIVAEINRSLDVLEATDRDILERHRSMRAIFDVTWTRLSEREQAHFAALSVFRGGFTLEAAREVAGATSRDLLQLVDCSLLSRVEGGRFEVHELLRQFAAEQLLHNPDREEAVREKHSRYYCEFLKKREGDLKGRRSQEAMTEIATDIENVRRAWKWAAEQEQTALMANSLDSLCLYHDFRSYDSQARELLRKAGKSLLSSRQHSDEDLARHRLLTRLLTWSGRFSNPSNGRFVSSIEDGLAAVGEAEEVLRELQRQNVDVRGEEAFLAFHAGEITRGTDSRHYLERSLSLYQELEDSAGQALAKLSLGYLEWQLGNFEEAADLARQVVEAFRVLGNGSGMAEGLGLLGLIEKHRGRSDEAHQAHRQSYAMFCGLGDRHMAAGIAGALAYTLVWSGEFANARNRALQGLELANELGLQNLAASLEATTAWSCVHLGHYDEARQYAERAVKLARGIGLRQMLGWALMALGQSATVAASYQEAVARFEEAAAILVEQSDSIWMTPLIYEVPALLLLGRLSEARRVLAKALRENMKTRTFFVAVEALTVAARLVAQNGDVEWALELSALGARYPFIANSRWFEDVADRRITALAKTLAAGDVTAAKARGKTRDLWQTADEVLQELEHTDL